MIIIRAGVVEFDPAGYRSRARIRTSFSESCRPGRRPSVPQEANFDPAVSHPRHRIILALHRIVERRLREPPMPEWSDTADLNSAVALAVTVTMSYAATLSCRTMTCYSLFVTLIALERTGSNWIDPEDGGVVRVGCCRRRKAWRECCAGARCGHRADRRPGRRGTNGLVHGSGRNT